MTSRAGRIALLAASLVLLGGTPAAAGRPYKQELPVPPAAVPGGDGAYEMRLQHGSRRPSTPTCRRRRSGLQRRRQPPSWPGPTIIAEKGTPTTVRWLTDLLPTHVLPLFDPTMPDMMPAVSALTPARRVRERRVGRQPVRDRRPAAGGDAGGRLPERAARDDGSSTTTTSTVQTRLNVYAGLAGGYLLRDADTGREGDRSTSSGAYELP